MRNFKLFFGLLAISILTFGIWSCAKDAPSDQTNVNLETRTTFNKTWLEQFRLNLLSPTNQVSYSVAEVEKGIEGLYNLIAAKELSIITNQRIYTDSITFSSNNGSLSLSQVSQFSEFVFQGIQNFGFGSTTSLALVDVSSAVNGSNVKFYRSVYTGDLSSPDLTTSSGMDCTIKSFKTSDCFLSSYGDADFGGTVNSGGPCNSPNNTTSAQEQVQRRIQRDIPKYVYDKKGNITGVIKYINSDCDHRVEMWQGGLTDYLAEFTNCSGLNLDYRDDLFTLSNRQYTGDELNCTICALKKQFAAICPPGKVVCNLNLWGDGFLPNTIIWRGEVCFCDAIVTPIIVREPDKNPTGSVDNTTLLNSNSILDF